MGGRERGEGLLGAIGKGVSIFNKSLKPSIMFDEVKSNHKFTPQSTQTVIN